MKSSIVRRQSLCLAAATVTLLLAGGASQAQAGTLHFCYQNLNAGSYCDSTLMSNVREVFGSAGTYGSICVKAFYSDGSAYGSYVCNVGVTGTETYTYHCYNQMNTASGRVLNDGPPGFHFYSAYVLNGSDRAYC